MKNVHPEKCTHEIMYVCNTKNNRKQQKLIRKQQQQLQMHPQVNTEDLPIYGNEG